MRMITDLSPCCEVEIKVRDNLYYCSKCNGHLEKIYNPYIELAKEGEKPND